MWKTPQLTVNSLWRLKTQTIHEMVWEPRVYQMSPVGPVGLIPVSGDLFFFRSSMGENLDMHPGGDIVGEYLILLLSRVLPDLSMKVHDFSCWCCVVQTEIQSKQWHDILQEQRVNIDQESVHWRSIDFWFLGRCRSLCHLLSILPLQLSVPGKLVLSGHKNKATDSSGLKRGVDVPTGSAAGSCRYLLAVPCFRF